MDKRWVKTAVGVVLAAAVLVVGGTWVYINVIEGDAPERLRVDAGAGAPSTTAAGAAAAGVDGTYKVTSGSQAGYRVKEVLFGQRAEAVGRTSAVTGQVVVAGNAVTSGSFTVDMTAVTSSEGRRDNQFRSRIMDVSTYPTSTFVLAEPITFSSLPADGEKVTAEATGDLTLRGTTKRVTIDVEAQRSGATVRVAGSFPVVFAEWGIPNPSFGPAQTEDDGELEFLLVLAR